MTDVDLVAALVDELYDVETIFRLHDLRDLLRVSEVESHVGEGRVEHAAACVAELTALTCRAGILTVETCERGERCLAAGHALGIFAQVFLHAVDLFL